MGHTAVFYMVTEVPGRGISYLIYPIPSSPSGSLKYVAFETRWCSLHCPLGSPPAEETLTSPVDMPTSPSTPVGL